MTLTTRRTLALIVAVVGVIGLASTPVRAANNPPRDLTAADLAYFAVPTSADSALVNAQQAVTERPETYAEAWYDGNSVILDTTDPDAAAPEGVRLRIVTANRLDLEQAREALTELMSSPAGKDSRAWAAFLDPRSNQTILAVEEPSNDLRESIKRIDHAALAILEDPRLQALSRTSDTSPHTGGAEISTPGGPCTSGFAWTGQATPSMLTAGHCAPSGGTVTVPSGTLGSITGGTGENWATGTGTVLFPGETTYRGDLALIALSSPGTTAGKVYTGGAGSNTRRSVGGTWTRSPASSDPYCTDGGATGETCAWTVTLTNANVTYTSGEIGRNVTVGTGPAPCLAAGDSGGPVYTIRTTDSKAIAKGIISAGSDGQTCTSTFTDIRLAIGRFGGTATTS